MPAPLDVAVGARALCAVERAQRVAQATAGAAQREARGGRRRRAGHRPAIEPTLAVALYDFVRVGRLRRAAPGTAVFTPTRRPPRGSLRRRGDEDANEIACVGRV